MINESATPKMVSQQPTIACTKYSKAMKQNVRLRAMTFYNNRGRTNMTEESRALLQKIQSSMKEDAKTTFSESELNHLGALIRITVEFYDYIQYGTPDLKDMLTRSRRILEVKPSEAGEIKYRSETILWAIDSFCNVNSAYSVLVGSKKSQIKWAEFSKESLLEQFSMLFSEFTKEKIFEDKCRLLLDLFKIQIVFAGVCYD